jgi:Ca2+-binding RTX toxin-like protein
MNTNLSQALSLVDRYLSQFATSPNFWPDFELAFGQNFDRLTAEQIRQSLSLGSFTRSIQVVQDQVLGLASGAFAAVTNTVYLRESLVASGDLEHISEVIIEEYGHSIDSLVNKEETPGDEGAIFRLLVKGVKLTQAMLADLREEDDWAMISIDGQQLAVEMAVFNGTTGDDTLGGVVDGDNIGNDIFTPLTGVDIVDGGDGVDTLIVDYSASFNVYTYVDSYGGTNINSGSSRVDFIGIEKLNLIGSQYGDLLYLSLTPGDSTLMGGDGSDTLVGGAGNDSLDGGNGDDFLSNRYGNDSLYGGFGNDDITGGIGNDKLYGGDGNDYLYGYGKNTSYGEEGNDVIYGSLAYGGNGNDIFYADYSLPSYLDGGSGNDVFYGGYGNDTMIGGGGADRMLYGAGDNTYIFQNGVSSSGSLIDDGRGVNDVLQFTTPVVLNIDTDIQKSGRNLLIDLNGDRLFDANDLSINNFFDDYGNAGDGLIETIQNLSGVTILQKFQAIYNNITVRNDFGNDKRADILLRNDDGRVGLWQNTGYQSFSVNVIAPWFADNNWQISGTGDFNNDKKSDILWRNTDGHVALWTMDGANLLSNKVIAPWFTDNNWKISATKDFNGDGKSDILWRNTDGHVALWTMDGANILSSSVIAPWFTDNTWKIAGTGDFNGDNKSDILWSKDDGNIAVWLMDGKNILSTSVLAKAPTDWKIKGVDDFDGDGKAEILVQNNEGIVGLWNTNGTTLLSTSINPRHESVDWQVIGSSDFNGDKNSNVLWQNTNGQLDIGDFPSYVPPTENSWKIVTSAYS